MSTQMLVSDLLEDLSTDEQQLLAGGQVTTGSDEDEDKDKDEEDGEDLGLGKFTGRSGVYLIRSRARAIIRVRKLR